MSSDIVGNERRVIAFAFARIAQAHWQNGNCALVPGAWLMIRMRAIGFGPSGKCAAQTRHAAICAIRSWFGLKDIGDRLLVFEWGVVFHPPFTQGFISPGAGRGLLGAKMAT